MRFHQAVFTLTLHDFEWSNESHMFVRPWLPVSQRCMLCTNCMILHTKIRPHMRIMHVTWVTLKGKMNHNMLICSSSSSSSSSSIDNLRDLYMIQMSFHIISELCISNNYCAIFMYNTIYILSTRMLVCTVA